MWQATYRYARANNKYMKNYDKNDESTDIEYSDAYNLYGWQCLKNFLQMVLDG